MGLGEVFTTTKEMLGLLGRIRYAVPALNKTANSLGQQIAINAERHGDHTMILFEGRSIGWRSFNLLANRYANALKAQGVRAGDSVSIMLENRIEMLAVLIAVNKLGAIAGLINTNLRGAPLQHCVSQIDSKKLIVGEELVSAVDEVRVELSLTSSGDYLYVPDGGKSAAPDWTRDIDTLSDSCPDTNPPETDSIDPVSTALYIFTSGTTGLPKAAIVSNRRFLASGLSAAKLGLRCRKEDRIYLCLPLYHLTGLMLGVGAALATGSTMFVRRKFSASQFLPEVREHNVRCMVYIGELCRYLVNTPAKPDDADNPLENLMGNGLRPDIWVPFKQRFSIKRISEFYGSTEGNVAFLNLLNKDRTIGLCPGKYALVKYDIDRDEIVRDENGRCIRVTEMDEPGLLLGEITRIAKFEGYTSKEATESKIVRNAFTDGDAWFNSGDLIKQIDVGFAFGIRHFQFVDRIGDTFRWRGENVSTNEVAEIITQHPNVQIANVYGVDVPGAEGRAGMASLVLSDGAQGIDMEDFSRYINRELPAFARPVFVRIQPELEVTGTFKLVKGDLKKQAFNINDVQDPIWVMKPGSSSYQRLEQGLYDELKAGTAGF
jgi:citronellyl-CoA synthetase